MSSTKLDFVFSFLQWWRRWWLRALFFWRRLWAGLSSKEKRLIGVLLVLFVVFWIVRAVELANLLSPERPVYGGVYKEVTFGEIRSLNPFFAESRAEKDIARILFLYLADYDEKGKIQGELLKSFRLGETQGELVLRSDMFWHDGIKVSADDIVFTFSLFKKVKALELWGKAWEGVKVKKVADNKVVLRYSKEVKVEPKNLRFPLLPAHLLKGKDLSKLRGFNFNLKPTGNGPFRFKAIQRLKTGDLVVRLVSFERFPFKPYLDEIQFVVKPSLQEANLAFRSFPFSGLSQVLLSQANSIKDKKTTFRSVSLPQYTAVFYNLKNDKFKSTEVRQALDKAIDRKQIIQKIEFVKLTTLPLPAGAGKIKAKFAPKEAEKVLRSKSLVISLLYVDSSPYREAAQLVADFWRRVGVKVDLVPADEFSLTDRLFAGDFEAVLWGETVGIGWDLTRWYSESRLNFSGFASRKVDEMLVKAKSKEDKVKVAEAIAQEYPASFLFSVPYVWATRGIKGVSLTLQGEQPADRFRDLSHWYVAAAK